MADNDDKRGDDAAISETVDRLEVHRSAMRNAAAPTAQHALYASNFASSRAHDAEDVIADSSSDRECTTAAAPVPPPLLPVTAPPPEAM